MAKERAVDKNIEELKKFLKVEDKIIIGSEQVLKEIKKETIDKVFIAMNTKKSTVESIEYYSKITKFEIVKLQYPNDELGVICKKPFSISVLGIIR